MIGILKKIGKWAIKTLKQEAKKEVAQKVKEIPFEDIGIPRRRGKK